MIMLQALLLRFCNYSRRFMFGYLEYMDQNLTVYSIHEVFYVVLPILMPLLSEGERKEEIFMIFGIYQVIYPFIEAMLKFCCGMPNLVLISKRPVSYVLS